MSYVINPFTGKLDLVGDSNNIDDDCIVFRKCVTLIADSILKLSSDECVYVADRANGNTRVSQAIDIESNGVLKIQAGSQVEVLDV